jgi:predicted RNase H-like HicB family nuclease
MLEFRIRVLDVHPDGFIGLVEGLPPLLAHAESAEEAEVEAVHLLEAHLERLMDRDETRIERDDFPTVRVTRLFLRPEVG